MTLSIPDKIRGFLFSPGEAFWQVRDEDPKDTALYLLVISIIYTLLSTLFSGSAVSMHPALLFFQLGIGTGKIILSFFIIFALTIAVSLAYAVWLHFWIILICGKRGVRKTIRTVFYQLTPIMLIGWIPVIGAIAAPVWSVLVGGIGIRELHQASFGRALLSILIAIITSGILAAVLFWPFLAESITSGPALVGPYHYHPGV